MDGAVYLRDPLAKDRGTPRSRRVPAATLDLHRDTVVLLGLTTASPQTSGQYVQLVDISPPTVAAPTSTGDFIFSVPTDNFAAVNAYHHCDALFRLVAGMGFTISTYFNGTTFPVRVDHRATIGTMRGWELRQRLCSREYRRHRLGRVPLCARSTGQPVGIACDWRVVLHEFGHALSGNCRELGELRVRPQCGGQPGGDPGDPGSLAPDRFVSFPWKRR